MNSTPAQRTALVLGGLLSSNLLSGCVVLGYSSGRGFFIWPSGIVLLLIVLLWVFLRGR